MPNAKTNLVIVESPSKAKTIGKYLGPDYQVKASMGHLRDLRKSTMSVDIDHDFEPEYYPIKGKEDIIKDLQSAAAKSANVFLATDPDREGEAISWHLKYLLDIPDDRTYRVTFNEITKDVVRKAIAAPRAIDQNLVDAQQARRVLDRIVGYQLSPLLWKKVRRGLSAGRVQSVATRLVVDRENEIRAFTPQEYWTIDAALDRTGKPGGFTARYYGDPKKNELGSREDVDKVLSQIAGKSFTVQSVKKTQRRKNPAPPFITSSLQQEASRKLNFTVKRTMMAAQKLYEGAAVEGHGTVGLITYMRTDSLRLSNDAIADAREEIKTKYGDALLPGKPNVYKTKNSAQDAHEAIRPTYASIKPADLKESLPADMYKLYKLIWERFIACQMKPAVYETVNADIKAGRFGFKASGSKLVFKGYMSVYVEGRDDDKTEKDKVLPPLSKDEILKLLKLLPNQHFTQPPQRFTEATLIKMLEEKGIGRPSTYAPTITTITARGYVTREKKQLLPTELGSVVTDIMTEHFPNIVGIAFTADMEKDLDEIEEGEIDWVKIVEDFYGPFEKTLKTADEKIGKVKIEDEKSDVICEKCGRTMVYKMGRFGKFLACPGFPECRNAKPIVKETGADCPKCGKKILEKKSKTGKTYFGCEDNPKCDFMTWDMPVAGEKCPKCGGLLLSKKGKKKQIVCANPDCGYTKE